MSDKIYIPLDREGESIEREEALARLGMPRYQLDADNEFAMLNYRIVLSMMVEFAMQAMEVPVEDPERQSIKYHLLEAAQEWLVG